MSEASVPFFESHSDPLDRNGQPADSSGPVAGDRAGFPTPYSAAIPPQVDSSGLCEGVKDDAQTDDVAGENVHHGGHQNGENPEKTPQPAPPQTKQKRTRTGRFANRKGDQIPSMLRREAGHYRVQLSQLPHAVRSIRKHGRGLREGIEQACIDRHGSISISQAMTIQTITRAEESIRIVERLLKDAWDGLDIEQRAGMLDRILKLSERRDHHLAKLKLDVEPETLRHAFAVLDAVPPKPVAPLKLEEPGRECDGDDSVHEHEHEHQSEQQTSPEPEPDQSADQSPEPTV